MKLQAGVQWGEVPLPLRFTPKRSQAAPRTGHAHPAGKRFIPVTEIRDFASCKIYTEEIRPYIGLPLRPLHLCRPFRQPQRPGLPASAVGGNTPLGAQAGGSGWVSPRPSQAAARLCEPCQASPSEGAAGWLPAAEGT